MQQYFLKSLVGLFLMMTTCQLVPVCALSFLRALAAEEAEVGDQQTMVESNIDPANELGNSRPEVAAKSSEKNGFPRKYVTMKLDRLHHGVEIEEGESYELSCRVDATPRPRVYWLRGDNPTKEIDQLTKRSVSSSASEDSSISRVESKYVIDCASKLDEGPIHCVAIAGEKMIMQSTIITVNENRDSVACKTERAPIITEHTSTILSISGSTVELSCRATGMPRPQTHWLDGNNSRIANRPNSRYKVLGNGDLLIEDLTWSDMGGFTCIAESTSGADRAETFLYPVKKE